jgi:hypothetical protein
MEFNADGSLPLCFLGWADQKLGTGHYGFYCAHDYWPGMNPGRDNIPEALADPNGPDIPDPAVSYLFFLSVVSKFEFRYKDKSIDQCATCNIHQANISAARIADRPALIAAWELHKAQADKGYKHRALARDASKASWKDVDLEDPALSVFPPPLAPHLPLAHPDLNDFTQCDMGGGLRTPLIKMGPQYYLRTLPSKAYYICSEARGDVACWWNETMGECGAQEICSVNYLYDTTRATGAGSRTWWVDGTASQCWNYCFWTYVYNCCNPESPTYHNDPATPLYSRCDMYRNPPGHTFMKCDATHGVVSKYGHSLSHVASTQEWCEEVGGKCRSIEPIDSLLMQTNQFRQWAPYLMQMYRRKPRSVTRAKYLILDYHWANFGWGKDTDGNAVYHPHEMWLYTCKGPSMEEWHKEEPMKVVFARNVRPDGVLPHNHQMVLPWLASKGRPLVPLSHPDFQSYDGPLPMDPLKARDLHKLGAFLSKWLDKDEIDDLYPEPPSDDDDDDSEEDDDGEDDSD